MWLHVPLGWIFGASEGFLKKNHPFCTAVSDLFAFSDVWEP
jgi:hypothetical protein